MTVVVLMLREDENIKSIQDDCMLQLEPTDVLEQDLIGQKN
jgi:hypothetical protein